VTAHGERRRLLLVDDEVLIQRVIGRSMRQSFEVVEAITGEDAIARIRAGEPFDAIVCDSNLGVGMSGIDFARQLAGLDAASYGRLIFLVGQPLPRSVAEEMARPILVKPFYIGELRRLLEVVGAREGGSIRPRARTHGRRGAHGQRVLRRA
jgi:two-component system, NtrC family, sensor kinase